IHRDRGALSVDGGEAAGDGARRESQHDLPLLLNGLLLYLWIIAVIENKGAVRANAGDAKARLAGRLNGSPQAGLGERQSSRHAPAPTSRICSKNPPNAPNAPKGFKINDLAWAGLCPWAHERAQI